MNWENINQERQKLLAASNNKENKPRLSKDYSPGNQILYILDADEHCSQPKMNSPI
jgi:hypothetical protein